MRLRLPAAWLAQDGEVHMFRRGVGRLVAAVRVCEQLQVLPYYIHGTDVLQPSPAALEDNPVRGPGTVVTKPQLGTDLHVIFGSPVDLSAYVAMQARHQQAVTNHLSFRPISRRATRISRLGPN